MHDSLCTSRVTLVKVAFGICTPPPPLNWIMVQDTNTLCRVMSRKTPSHWVMSHSSWIMSHSLWVLSHPSIESWRTRIGACDMHAIEACRTLIQSYCTLIQSYCTLIEACRVRRAIEAYHILIESYRTLTESCHTPSLSHVTQAPLGQRLRSTQKRRMCRFGRWHLAAGRVRRFSSLGLKMILCVLLTRQVYTHVCVGMRRCMYIYVCMCMCVYISVCMYSAAVLFVGKKKSDRGWFCVCYWHGRCHVCVCVHVWVCIYICMYIHIDVCACMCVRICICKCMYVNLHNKYSAATLSPLCRARGWFCVFYWHGRYTYNDYICI